MKPLWSTATLVAGLACAAAPAMAECFDETVLTRGLTVNYDNGDWTTIRRTNDGYQQIDEYYEGGDSMMRFRAHRGVYFVEEYEPGPDGAPVAGTGLVIEFAEDPASLPDPAAGTQWKGDTVNIFDDGVRRPEQATISFTAAPSISLSGCDYEVIRTSVFYDWGDEGWLELVYSYLPAIGTTLLLSSQFEGEDASTYSPVGLERASK